LSTVISWSWKFSNLKSLSASYLRICAFGLIYWVWGQMTEVRNNVSRKDIGGLMNWGFEKEVIWEHLLGSLRIGLSSNAQQWCTPWTVIVWQLI
jgi:hypothetical protein